MEGQHSSLDQSSACPWTIHIVDPAACYLKKITLILLLAMLEPWLPRKLGCSSGKLMRNTFPFWQLTDLYVQKYQLKLMPNYFINYAVPSHTSGNQAFIPSIFTPPLPGAEGNLLIATRLVYLILFILRGEQYLSSHQWVVPPACLGSVHWEIQFDCHDKWKYFWNIISFWKGKIEVCLGLQYIFCPLSFYQNDKNNNWVFKIKLEFWFSK